MSSRIIDRIRAKKACIQAFSDWYKVVFPFNRFFTGEQTLHLRNGFPITIHDIFSSELSFVTSFFNLDEYRLGTISLPPKPIIFDLGANIGAFSIDAKAHYPDATIVAYEPHPVTFALLEKNAPFAELKQEAAAGKDGTVMIQDDGPAIARKLVEKDGIPVQARSLDTILKDVDHVDLLKVDVEGAEFDLIEQASEATIKKIEHMIIELHAIPWGSRNNWAEEFFIPRGYSVEWMYPWGVAHIWKNRTA